MLQATRFKQAVTENTLRSCQIFAGLPPPDTGTLAEMAVAKHLEKGQYLFRAGESVQGFYVMQKGAVNVRRVSASGKEQVIHVFHPVESLPRPRSSRRAVIPPTRAPSRRTALLIPKSGFIDLLRSRPELALRMLASMAQHLRVVVRLVDDLTLKDIETRLANWLVRRCPRPLTDAPQTIELIAPNVSSPPRWRRRARRSRARSRNSASRSLCALAATPSR